MKVSRTELQLYFKSPLPTVEQIADALTFHVFEIDGIEGDILDVKVLPNRAADCSSAEGIARELAAILSTPLQGVGELSYEGQPVVETTLARLNERLGANFTRAEVLDVFSRLGFRVKEDGEILYVVAPRPRTDIMISEDLAEEVGQILGYDRIPVLELPPLAAPVDQDRYRGIERMKDMLVEKGFIEVSTQSFVAKGDIELANPFDKTKPMLRASLREELDGALVRAKQYAPLILGPHQKPKLFEIGSVFPSLGEYLELRMTESDPSLGHTETSDNLSIAKLEEFGKGYEPKKYTLDTYHAFSVYPFVLRDIALWVPENVTSDSILKMIEREAGDLLVRAHLFDIFKKDLNGVKKISYAFNLIFQSDEKTLSDDEVNVVMGRIQSALTKEGYEVR